MNVRLSGTVQRASVSAEQTSMVAPSPNRDAILGGLYGLLIGDALGVPYEFSLPGDLPAYDLIEFEPPADFKRAHRAAPRAAWSDDGAQALCLLASLLEKKELDLADLGKRFVAWYDEGYMAVSGKVFDIGNQTYTAIAALRAGADPERASLREEHHNGNGSLMRVLPLALWHTGSDAELVRDAARQSLLTHAHPRSQVCCALYCLWARATLAGHEDAWQQATQRLRAFTANDAVWQHELENYVRPDARPGGSGSGYVVDCLHSARLALTEPSFERVLKRAICLGMDTDTTAAVAGGIAGLRFGLSGIPERWVAGLAGRELVEPLVGELSLQLRLA